MGKRLNIGVYIGPDDTDIAAWFNLLQNHHMSRAKWVRGLFSAYALKRSLSIGTINIHAPLVSPPPASRGEEPLFGRGSSHSETVKRDRFGYGWQIRGPGREFIHGSVINVSVSKDEILTIVDEVWKNGHQLATFLKALIRKNLVYGADNVPPDLEALQKIYSEFIVSQNSKKIRPPERKKRMPTTAATPEVAPKDALTDALAADSTSDVVPELTAPTAKTFNFRDTSDVNLTPSPPTPVRRNPLLDEI